MTDFAYTPPAARPHSTAVYKRIVFLFLALIAGTVLLVVYVILSRAQVVVLAAPEEVRGDFLVDVAKQPSESEIKGLVVEATDTLRQEFPTATLANVDTRAEGRVRITSTLYRPQTLIATTRLLAADGRLFRTRKTVTIPANGTVEVDVFADASGKPDGLESATFSIPGFNESTGRFFTVKSAGAFTGGTKEIRMVAKTDLDAATETVRKKVEDGLTANIRAKAAEAGGFSGERISVETVKSVSDAEPGSEAEKFAVSVTVRVVGVFYDKDAFEAAVRSRLEERLPSGRALTSVGWEDVDTTTEKIDLVGGRANMRVSAHGTATLSAAAPALSPAKLTGVTADAARVYLEKIDGVSSASVKVTPFWSHRMPSSPDRIKIEVR